MNTLLLCCKSFCERLTTPNEKITLIICGTVVLLSLIAIAASIYWYWPKRKSPKGDTTTENPTSAHSTSSRSELEFERWFSLKKEYQKKALDYVWERSLGGKSTQNGQEGGKSEKKLDPSTSCENDTYLKYIKELISQIDNKLEAIHPSEKTQEKEM